VPHLTVQDQSREYLHQIESDRCTIGRAETNTIPIGDAKASKEHCAIVRRGDRWKLVDLESKNGTKVNGAYRNKAWLEHDDEVAIGATRLRFGVAGARRAATRAGTPAGAGAGAGAGAVDGDAFAGEEGRAAEGGRYRRDDPADKLLKYGGFVLGAVVIMLIAGYYMKQASDDPYNVTLLRRADELVARGDFQGALDYLEANVDAGGAGYYEVVKRMDELRQRLPVVVSQQKEDEAKRLVARLGMKIKGYHQGKTRTTSPEEILEICRELKTEYADTEQTRQAREVWPAWFAGKVPERAVDYIAGDAKLRRDWEETLRRADEYRREDRFLQAIEAVTRFVTVREALMPADELQHYEKARDQRVRAYEKLAESAYYERDRIARDLVKARRYDEAVQQFQRVVDRFGIDRFVRKAQERIAEIRALKRERTR